MSTEERKEQLLEWVTKVNNPSILDALEQMKAQSESSEPNFILNFLEHSSNSKNRTKHTSAKDLIR